MILTNRLTGHSKGFLSTYTLPPNQAVSPERQRIINERYNNDISYKNAKEIILDKSKKLLRHLDMYSLFNIKNVRDRCLFTTEDAESNSRVQDDSVALTVTSPPFLDVVRYDQDNWLRCYINNIDLSMINMSMIKSVREWDAKMFRVLKDLHRVTKCGGHVAFEVGEVRSGTVKLEESIVETARKIGFKIEKIMINKQSFTKTSNIWGIKNNTRGTNTNRIVLLKKV